MSSETDIPRSDAADGRTERDDRRRARRLEATDLGGTVEVRAAARVLNLGLSGLAIETDIAMRAGGSYVVLVETDRDVVPLATTAAWCNLVRTDRTPDGDVVPVYQAGLEIAIELSPAASELLSFIRTNSRVELQQRLYGRFDVEDRRRVTVERRRPCEIETVSSYGLSMRTSIALSEGDRVRLDLDLGTATRFRPRGLVASVKPISRGDEPSFRVGVAFEQLDEADRRALEELLEMLAG